MSRAVRWTVVRPDELSDVVEVHPLSAPGEPVTYVREDDETVKAFIRVRSTCHDVGGLTDFECSSCGYALTGIRELWKFCPGCGARVVYPRTER